MTLSNARRKLATGGAAVMRLHKPPRVRQYGSEPGNWHAMLARIRRAVLTPAVACAAARFPVLDIAAVTGWRPVLPTACEER